MIYTGRHLEMTMQTPGKQMPTSDSSASDGLAKTFSRLGWIGFWLQIAFGAIPLILAIYAVIFTRNAGPGTRGGLLLIEFLTFAGLLVLVFTTVWSYGYTRLAKKMADPARRPSDARLRRAAWTGVTASALGIVFSMLVMLVEVAQLLIYFLRAPQAGVPVIQTTGGGEATWVSAADMMSLMALVLTVFGEFAVLGLSLWLVYRTVTASAAAALASAE
jgi:uncharacterized protein YjeT (DUF2065 family)